MGEIGRTYPNVKLDSLVEARLDLRVEPTLIFGARHGEVRFIPAGMIDLINGIRNVKTLHSSSVALELLYFSCQELPVFDSLVCLSIESDKKRGWQILPLVIKNSPNLETLKFKGLKHYMTKKCGDACVCCYSEENKPSCLSSCRVKVLEISDYRGFKREANQMKHFLGKLHCLELVEIYPVNWNILQATMEIQLLSTLPRASSNCKIEIEFNKNTTASFD